MKNKSDKEYWFWFENVYSNNAYSECVLNWECVVPKRKVRLGLIGQNL